VGSKKRNSFQFNWQSSTPIPFNPNTAPSQVLTGTMSATNTIYSNIQDLSNFDNQGLEVTWSGSPNGAISILGSESGANFYALSFTPSLTQPSGSAGGYLLNLNQFPWRYVLIQYANTSGTGVLTVWIGSKDLN
jgi:hypothetical protein